MNRTPNTTAINNTTSPTPQTAPKTINYAAAAKKNSTQLPQSPVPAPSVVPAQQQQSPQQSVAASQAPQAVVVPSSTQQQQTNAPIAVNGTKNQSTSSASFAVTTKNTPQQSQILYPLRVRTFGFWNSDFTISELLCEIGHAGVTQGQLHFGRDRRQDRLSRQDLSSVCFYSHMPTLLQDFSLLIVWISKLRLGYTPFTSASYPVTFDYLD